MKTQELILVLIITINAPAISTEVANMDCRVLLEKFSKSSSEFMRCATQFSRPIRMCRECKEDFLNVRKYYDALEHAQEQGIVCKDLLTSHDKVEIIKETYNFIIGSEGLWAKGYCSSCYTEPFNEESLMTNITKDFFIRYETVDDCFKMFPNGSQGTNRSDACDECLDDYNDLQEYYKDYFLAQQFPDVKYCYDVVDAMNSTQQSWGSGKYNCGRKLKTSSPLITAVVIVLSSPVLLYLLVKYSPGTTTARERLVAQTNIHASLTAASHTARAAARLGEVSGGPSASDVMTSEAEKLTSHLALLRAEYVKLQQKCSRLERELAVASAQAGDQSQDSFVCRLLSTVSSLHRQPLYSDLTILTPATQLAAHKFVLDSRSSSWGVPSLSEVQTLDWRELEEEVSSTLLRWVYTDTVSLSGGDQGDRFTLQLMAAASKFSLQQLVDTCEQALVSSVSVTNCIRFYATAHEINASKLAEHCSQLISSNWEKFSYEDFESLSAELVYQMLKSKAKHPLHSAIRLKREDVVFLYLIEFNSELNMKLNEIDTTGRLPLDLALELKEDGIARSLVEHKANINQMNAEGETLLHLAITRRDVKSSLFLLESGAQVNLTTVSERLAPLHVLATTTDHDMMTVAEAVIEKGADLNLQTIEGETALVVSVKHDHTAMFELLLSKGSNLELASTDGKTALWHSLVKELGPEAKWEEGTLASKLVSAGADPSSVCSGGQDTILHSLSRAGHEDAGLYLVSVGARVDSVNALGETPLHVAGSRGLATLATALVVAGADPNIQTNSGAGEVWRQTPLHLALESGQETVVSCLLEFSQPCEGLDTKLLDLNIKNSAEETPLCAALARGQLHLAKQMIQSGADVNVTDGSGLSLLLRAIQEKNISAATFLLSQGADINTRSPQGLTPLELAVQKEADNIVEKLAAAGADMSNSSSGEPILWISLEGEKYDTASILVRHGVDTDSWGPGPDGCSQTLLHRAVDENKEEAACFLVRAGCDMNCSRRAGPGGTGGEEATDGQAALHLATQWGQESVVTTLIEHGADINLQDSEGKTVVHHAIESGHQGIINMLLGCPNINLSARDKAGLSPFATAMTQKNNTAARVILELEPGAAEQPDSRGKNFLHTAIIRGDLESLLFLISINVNVHSKTGDSSKLAPLLLAVQVGNEMMVRNLLLAGASAGERTLTGQTGLHLAAESDTDQIASILLANGVDFSALDEEGNNALHVAVKLGNLKTARVLLTESRIDADVFNGKGRSAFHVLARFCDNNPVEMCDLFLECMPEYNIDRPDGDGNTPLLLAYIKGSGDVCRALVKKGAILGTLNKAGVNIFNHPVATKQLLFRLLDILSQEPRWGEGDCCEECLNKFGLTTRKHHCRHCGRLLCSKCSAKEMPIMKYNLSKPVRVCDVCSDLLTLGVGAGGNPF